MRDTSWLKVWRDATLHLPRTVLVALAIAVALAGAGTVLVSWALVQRATEEGYLTSDPPAATLTVRGPDAALRALAGRVPGVRDAQTRRSLSLPMQVQGTWHSAMVFAAEDLRQVRLGTLEGVEGSWPPPPGTIAIERSSVEFSGASVGDSILVTAGDSTVRALAISAIVRDVGLAPGWMEHVVYVWTTTATLAGLELDATPNQLQLAVTSEHQTRDNVRRVADSVRKAIEQSGYQVLDVDVPEPGEHIHAAQMDSMLMTQGAFGALALLAAVFLVVNLMSAILTGQLRQIGIMKTLGASDGKLTAMYLAFAAGVGALSAAVALPLSMVLGRRYASMRGDMLNFDVARYDVPWWTPVLLAIIGVGLPVLAAWFPVRHGVRITVAQALRDLGISHDGDTSEPRLARAGGWSRILALSVRNAFRRRSRMRLTMLTLASGGAVFVAAANLQEAVIGSMDLIFGSQRYDFSVRLAEPQDASAVESVVRAVSGVTQAEAWAGARATVMLNGAPAESFAVAGIPDHNTLLDLTMHTGECPKGEATFCGFAETTNQLVVSRSMRVIDPSLALGATIELEIAGRRAPWTIAGVFEGGPAPTAYTTSAALDRARGAVKRSSVMVDGDVTGVAGQVELIARVRAALSGAGVQVATTQRVEESRRVTEDHLLMVVQFLGAMGWVMILVGGMGLASTMGLSVLERTREIGVMRAIGAQHGTLFLLIQAEGLVIALLGWAIALPLSLPFSLLLGEAFSRIMFRVPVLWLPNLPAATAWLGAVVIISLIACAWPAWRAMRQRVAPTLAYEQ